MTYSARDSSFFTIQFPEQSVDQVVLQKDIISLSVTEEMDKQITGSFSLYDPNFIYSRILRTGALMLLTWGYKKAGIPLSGDLGNAPDLFSQSLIRRGLRVLVQNPSGNAGNNGVYTYNANFFSMDFRGPEGIEVYTDGTKGDLVRSLLAKIGVLSMEVQFEQSNGKFTLTEGERRVESVFKYLVRVAREWGAFFKIGYLPNGTTAAIFVDPWRLKDSLLVQQIQGVGGKIELNYKVGKNPNVLEYSWQNNAGENGEGDSAQIMFSGGQPVIIRRTVETETVRTWVLDMNRVRAACAAARETGGYAEEWKLVTEIAKETDFEKVRDKYFTPVDATTAPNGVGYSVNVKLLGTPALTAGSIIRFGQGFPDMFTSGDEVRGMAGNVIKKITPRGIDFYVRKVSHTISASGYFTDIEVVDVLSIAPTGMVVR